MLPTSKGTKRPTDPDIDTTPKPRKDGGRGPTRPQRQLRIRPPSRSYPRPSRPHQQHPRGWPAPIGPDSEQQTLLQFSQFYSFSLGMLGVPDLPRSFRFLDLVHLSSFAPVQDYMIGTGAGTLPCFSLTRLGYLYFYLLHCLYCISFCFKGRSFDPPTCINYHCHIQSG